jgi:hypothetical protein
MSELTNWKREKRGKEREAEIVSFVSHPVHCVATWKHFSALWGVSTRTVRVFTSAAVKNGKIARRAGWYVPVGKNA